jgi:hypothetical protein
MNLAAQFVIAALERIEIDRELARESERSETIDRRRERRPALNANQRRLLRPST